MPINIVVILEIVVALGLINVWIVRASRKTSYRGGEAGTLKEEFAVYGLPAWFCYLIGILKIGLAIILLVGVFIPSLRLPAALAVSLLMVGAVAMHAKVGDPLVKTLPAALMLCMSLVITLGSYSQAN